jgi:hypothetical protein
VKQEGPLNTNAVRGDPPNRERCARSAPANANDGALEDLHALALPFNNAHVYFDGIAGAQLRNIRVSF